eukprot:6213039-Pleurochrysis_carterae.AAC.1
MTRGTHRPSTLFLLEPVGRWVAHEGLHPALRVRQNERPLRLRSYDDKQLFHVERGFGVVVLYDEDVDGCGLCNLAQTVFDDAHDGLNVLARELCTIGEHDRWRSVTAGGANACRPTGRVVHVYVHISLTHRVFSLLRRPVLACARTF